MAITKLKKLSITKFRALSNVEIEFGKMITVICGKNGTSKSSILGIAAQIFSFEKDYQSGDELNFSTITGVNFKSKFADHFRFSSTFDVSGSLEVTVELFDGYTNSDATGELTLSTRAGATPRPVVRKNSTAQGSNTSRNFTHPVIFLSLQRLLPISSRSSYNVKDFSYLTQNKDEFISLNNALLNKQSSNATGTDGSIKSAVAHADDYDQDSVSAGEDNAGQIIMAILSFKKLKAEYGDDYKGGLLLIDEADAGLFPAAQLKLIDILFRYARDLKLQVIMTSHSPTMIERLHELNQEFSQQKNYKTIYLSNTFGSVKAMHDFSWPQIHADLLTKTMATPTGESLPKVNLYFEDAEGADFFSHLMFRAPCNRYTTLLKDLSLGCTNYAQLISKKIPEFATKSLIILDGDIANNIKNLSSVVPLPANLPPDQLIFEFLFNLPPDDEFWTNNIQFTQPVLRNIASEILSTLHINGAGPINLASIITTYQAGNDGEGKKKKLRKVFKDFYKTTEFQALLKQRGEFNPWRKWISQNSLAAEIFKTKFITKLIDTYTIGWGVDRSKIPFSP